MRTPLGHPKRFRTRRTLNERKIHVLRRHQLAVFPAWSDNPYLNMTLLLPTASGYEVLGSKDLDTFENHLRRLAHGDIAHVHWTSPVCQGARSLEEATERFNRFVSAITQAHERGAGIVWTIHNRLPHETKFFDLELALCRFLAEVADRVVIMNPDTIAIVADLYKPPAANVRVLPHPSYDGIYPTTHSRAEARASFGLQESTLAVLFFGQMRPYKGLNRLLAAVDAAHSSGLDVALLMAGKTFAHDLGEIDEKVPSAVRVVRKHSYVPHDDVQRWFAAADIAVFPYDRVLNSGSVSLAATFGVPTVLPDESHLRSEYGVENWVHFFDPKAPERTIAEIFERSDRQRLADERLGARRFSRNRLPSDVSYAYLDILREVSRAGLAVLQV